MGASPKYWRVHRPAACNAIRMDVLTPSQAQNIAFPFSVRQSAQLLPDPSDDVIFLVGELQVESDVGNVEFLCKHPRNQEIHMFRVAMALSQHDDGLRLPVRAEDKVIVLSPFRLVNLVRTFLVQLEGFLDIARKFRDGNVFLQGVSGEMGLEDAPEVVHPFIYRAVYILLLLTGYGGRGGRGGRSGGILIDRLQDFVEQKSEDTFSPG